MEPMTSSTPELGPQQAEALRAAQGTDSSAPVLPAGVRIAAAWSWRLLVILVAVGVLIWLGSFVSTLIIAVLVAALLAGLLYPFVHWLRSKRVMAGIATAIVEIGAMLLVLGLLTLVGQQLITGFSELSDQAIAGYRQVMAWLSEGPLQLSVEQIDGAVNSAISAVQNNSSQLLNGAAAVGSTVGNIGTGMLIALFTLVFFLMEGERIWLFIVRLFPRRARTAVNGAGRRGWNSLVSYARIQVFVAFVDAVGIGLAAFFLGVPLALPLGVLVFLGSFIPIIGAVATGAIAVLLALVANGPINALIMLLAVLLVQQIESNLLQPLVMGKAVSLHPLAVVLVVTLGSLTLGIVGALFAVPFLAIVNTVVRYLASRAWEDDPNIRTEPYQFPWEKKRAEKKSASEKVKARLKARSAQEKAEKQDELGDGASIDSEAMPSR